MFCRDNVNWSVSLNIFLSKIFVWIDIKFLRWLLFKNKNILII